MTQRKKQQEEEAPTALPFVINHLRLQSVLLPLDEIALLEWLIMKYLAFGRKRFFYSLKRVAEENKLKKDRLRTILKKFIQWGIVDIKVEGNAAAHSRVTYFDVKPQEIEMHILDFINPSDKEYTRMWKRYMYDINMGYKTAYHTPANPRLGEKAHKILVRTYHERVRLYNKGELRAQWGEAPGSKKIETSLPANPTQIQRLAELMRIHGEEAVTDAFTALADDFLLGRIVYRNKPIQHPLSYFLAYNNLAGYTVFDMYLDKFNGNYTLG